MPRRLVILNARPMPGVLEHMPGRSINSASRPMPGVLEHMPGVLEHMPGRSINSASRPMPGVLEHMPRQSALSASRPMLGVLEHMPGVLEHMPGGSAGSNARHMPRHSAVGRDQPACPAQHGIAVDRFAREIVAILRSSCAARSRQLNAKPLGGRASFLSVRKAVGS